MPMRRCGDCRSAPIVRSSPRCWIRRGWRASAILWVNELAFLRGIHPFAPIGATDLDALVALAARCLRLSATVPGMYQVTTGDRRRGSSHWVVGRAGRPCLRCGIRVRVRDEVADDPEQRRTWWCPRCQPSPSAADVAAPR